MEYVRLVSLISGLWDKAREKAAIAVNTELLDASWETGRYIVEYEQHGNVKAEYGKQLLTNLSKDLTRLRGKGYSRSNLFNMRLFYVRFPKIQTVSGQLTWSHYIELLKCDDPLEMQFNKAVIGHQLGKQVAKMFRDMLQIEMLQASIA